MESPCLGSVHMYRYLWVILFKRKCFHFTPSSSSLPYSSPTPPPIPPLAHSSEGARLPLGSQQNLSHKVIAGQIHSPLHLGQARYPTMGMNSENLSPGWGLVQLPVPPAQTDQATQLSPALRRPRWVPCRLPSHQSRVPELPPARVSCLCCFPDHDLEPLLLSTFLCLSFLSGFKLCLQSMNVDLYVVGCFSSSASILLQLSKCSLLGDKVLPIPCLKPGEGRHLCFFYLLE